VIEEERAMEANPTDKRIDDLSGRVGRFEDRFVRFEDKVDARFDKVDARLAEQDHKLDSINRTVWAGIVAAVVIKFLFG
jgi:hypothetical protein